MNIVFDGQVFAQRITGQYRYADEILMEFDKIISNNEFTIVVPESVDIADKFNNIKVIQYGKSRGIKWTQTSLPVYLKKNEAISFGFCNITPSIRPGMAVVYDIGYKVYSGYRENLYGKLSSAWHCYNYYVLAKTKLPIVTDSEFSKNQIVEYYHVAPKRIVVIPCGWQHYNKIIPDNSIFGKFQNLQKKNYYFALSSLEERKNFKWVLEAAKKNPEETFVIAGGNAKTAAEQLDFDSLSNVIYTGYISDGEAKALMANAKAFLFPSTFEGFGIPPLEAMSVGTKVLCSNSSSLSEVCGKSVVYFDPYDYDITPEKLSNMMNTEPEESPQTCLERYSWEKSAKKLYALLTKMRDK